MSLLLILAVGQDPSILSTRSSVLRAAGYLVMEASSAQRAIEMFKHSDFDLVVLCHSLKLDDRDLLTRTIRSMGSKIPVLAAAPISHSFSPGLADGVLSSRPENLRQEIEENLQKLAAADSSGGPSSSKRSS